MKFEKLVPNIFYVDIADGVKMFVDCLGFEIGHDERTSRQPFCVVEKDGLRINLFQNTELAKEHSPEFLHPTPPKITLRQWGAKEFALMDGQIGVIIQEW